MRLGDVDLEAIECPYCKLIGAWVLLLLAAGDIVPEENPREAVLLTGAIQAIKELLRLHPEHAPEAVFLDQDVGPLFGLDVMVVELE